MLLGAERRLKIKKLLREEGSVQVSQLSELFNVSEVTIRRDLAKLEKEGSVKRIHGGAMAIDSNAPIFSFLSRAQEKAKEKELIGKKAAELVNNGNTIILDSGTTTSEVAKNLKGYKNLKVITNALNIALELAENPEISVVVPGGSLKGPSLSLVGSQVIEFVRNVNVDIAFLSVQGVSLEKGLTNNSISDLYLKRAIIDAAKEVILVVDSSKFNKVGLYTVAPVTAVNVIVTDENIPPSLLYRLLCKKIKVIVAEKKTYSDMNHLSAILKTKGNK